MTGIPEVVLQGMQQPTQQQNLQQPVQNQPQQTFQMPGGNNQATNINNNQENVAPTEQETPLSFLAKDKNFQMMKLMIQANPS